MWSNLRAERYKEFFTEKHVITVGVTRHWNYGLMIAYAFGTFWITVGPFGFYLIVE